ncbi:MAG: hypothetical protein JNM90_25575 [Burkholderiales bacterium]|nr:hypothetical protein [Burkholderiales bacterium]
MSHPAVIKASALIHAGNIAAAESALSELVDTEGDTALVAVLDELAPRDLLAIMREYDAARPSVVNLLVTPRQFAEAVIMERLYAERNRDRLRAMVNSVIFRDDVDPDEFIAALAEKDLGLEVLADYLDERFDEIAVFKDHGSFVVTEEERVPRDEEDDAVRDDQFELPKGGVGLDEVRDGDWMELTWRLAHHHPDEFFHVYQILAARTRAAEAAAVPARPAEAGDDGAAAAERPGPAGAGAGAEEESAL